MADRGPDGPRTRSGRLWLASGLALAALAVVINLATEAIPTSWSWARNGWLLWPTVGILVLISAGLAGRLTPWADPEKQHESTPSAPVPLPAPGPTPVATSGQRVVGELPGASPSFQQRPELTELIGVFDAGGLVAVVCALTGARGVGKTQLAAAYARRQAVAGCSLVAWVSAETTDTLIAGLDEIAHAVGVADHEGDSVASALRLRAYLQTRQDLALLVIDNVADADQVRRFIPVTGICQVVLTSTDHAVAQLGNLVEVSMFGRGQSQAYLRSRTGLDDDEGADQVAEELGDLPLALAQAASVIQLQQISYPRYLSRLRSMPVAQALPRHRGDPYPKGTTEAIVLSVQAAENTDESGLTKRLLELIAVLSPNGAQRSLIRQIFKGPESDTTNPVAAKLDETLARLVGLSLLVWGESGTSVIQHRLVARVIRDRLHLAGSLPTVLIATVQALTPLRIAGDQAWAQRAQGDQLVAHALMIWTTALHHSSNEAPLVPEQLAYCAEMANWAVDHLTVTADLSRATDIGAQVLAECERVLGVEHPGTLTARNNLATAYASAGKLAEAIPLYQQTLRGREQELGAEHPDTLTTRRLLAYWQGESGDPAGAVTAFEQLLTDRLRVLGPDHPNTLDTRSNLAHWRGEAGDPTAAVTTFEQLLTDRLRVLGPDHPNTLTTRSNLARWKGEAGDPTAAVTTFEQLLTDRLRVLGPDHPDTLTTRSNLARWKGEAGDPAAAVTALEQLLPDRLRVLGPDHPDTLTTRSNLARWRGQAGDLAAAVTALEQLLPDRLRVLGPDHPDTLTTRHNLARWKGEAGDPAATVTAFEQLLTDELRVLGPDHPHTLTTRSKLAYWKGEAGDPIAAVIAFEQLLPDRLRVLGPDHPHTLTTRSHLARWKGEAGDPTAAVTAFEELLPDRLRVLGPDHPHTLTTRSHLARWKGEAGDPTAAVSTLEQLLPDQLRVLGPHHPHTLTTRTDLASWRNKAHDQMGLS